VLGGFPKRWGIYWRIERLSASQGQLCFIKLVGELNIQRWGSPPVVQFPLPQLMFIPIEHTKMRQPTCSPVSTATANVHTNWTYKDEAAHL
jgi:hypothetical protein